MSVPAAANTSSKWLCRAAYACLFGALLGCGSRTLSPRRGSAAPNERRTNAPETSLLERVRALTRSTVAKYSSLGLSIDAKQLDVDAARPVTYVEGLRRNASHFEIDGFLHSMSATARMFGLPIGRSVEELETLSPFAVAEVTLAYYDFERKAFVVRDDPRSSSESLDVVVAHELGHAYQDFVLGGIESYLERHLGSPDTLRVARSLLEGQATLFAEAIALHERGVAIAILDPALMDPTIGRLTTGESYALLYDAGRKFLLSRYRHLGLEGLKRALEPTPSSTEQLLHPEKFAVDLPQPIDSALSSVPSGATLVFDGTWGEMLLFQRLLLISGDTFGAKIATMGWDGDRMRVFRFQDGSYSMVWQFVWDRDLDSEQFQSFLAERLLDGVKTRLRSAGRRSMLVYTERAKALSELAEAFAWLDAKPLEQPGDAESTAAIETHERRRESLRPVATDGRWVWPLLGLSFAIPDGFFPFSVRGVDLLAMTPEDGFSDSVTVTYEQDLHGGDLASYVAEQERTIRHTDQVWLGARVLRNENVDIAHIELAVPQGSRSARADLLVVRRDNGTLDTITIATGPRHPARGREIVTLVERTLRLEPPAPL
ncbi:MAG: hypothetical protein QM784_00910 [Polyangiaceae bacterium]